MAFVLGLCLCRWAVAWGQSPVRVNRCHLRFLRNVGRVVVPGPAANVGAGVGRVVVLVVSVAVPVSVSVSAALLLLLQLPMLLPMLLLLLLHWWSPNGKRHPDEHWKPGLHMQK